MVNLKAIRMRKHPTPAEHILWQEFRARRRGYKVRRQHPMLHKYIVDFYVASARLVIEVDGNGHTFEKDEPRTCDLIQSGVRVIRFTNKQVYDKLPYVLAKVDRFALH